MTVEASTWSPCFCPCPSPSLNPTAGGILCTCKLHKPLLKAPQSLLDHPSPHEALQRPCASLVRPPVPLYLPHSPVVPTHAQLHSCPRAFAPAPLPRCSSPRCPVASLLTALKLYLPLSTFTNNCFDLFILFALCLHQQNVRATEQGGRGLHVVTAAALDLAWNTVGAQEVCGE